MRNKDYTYEDLDKEFKLGMFAGVALTIGVIAIGIMCYALYHPEILGR